MSLSLFARWPLKRDNVDGNTADLGRNLRSHRLEERNLCRYSNSVVEQHFESHFDGPGTNYRTPGIRCQACLFSFKACRYACPWSGHLTLGFVGLPVVKCSGGTTATAIPSTEAGTLALTEGIFVVSFTQI